MYPEGEIIDKNVGFFLLFFDLKLNFIEVKFFFVFFVLEKRKKKDKSGGYQSETTDSFVRSVKSGLSCLHIFVFLWVSFFFFFSFFFKERSQDKLYWSLAQ